MGPADAAAAEGAPPGPASRMDRTIGLLDQLLGEAQLAEQN
jgi:hypothetical protein